LLKDNLNTFAKNIPAIKEGPYYKGVCMYKDSNVTIKIVAKCLEEDRFQVERDLNREYRRILTENNIDIAYPQVVVNYSKSKDIDVTPQDKKSADNFTKKQKKLSKDMDEQQN
jgi:small conductance mechanosensitive channel